MGFVIVGALVGFLAGLLGWAALEVHWVAALALWATGGPLGAVMAVVAAVRRPNARPVPLAT